MNDDFDSKFGGESSFGFERKTSSGFASGSFDRETSFGFAGGSFDSGYGSNDGYGSGDPMSYNDNNNYGSGSPMSYNDNNNYGSGDPMSYNGSNSYNSGGNGFGGSTYNPEPDYDPNAPLYHPEQDSYDPNAPLYTPSAGFSSPVFSSSTVNTVTVPKRKNKAMIIILIALGLTVLVIVGITVYNKINEKQSIKDYLESADGKRQIAVYQAAAKYTSDINAIDVFAEGDDTMVCDYVLNITYLPKNKIDEMDRSMEAQKESLKKEIRNIMDKNKIREFRIVYRYRNSSRTLLKEYTVGLDD